MTILISPLPISAGKVYLVGAGPGDPGLVTVRATECLQQADVVLFDALINQDLLTLYAPTAERISVRKRKGRCDKTQEETTRLLISLSKKGKTVVRLKGGDPITFGRGAEEAMALRDAGLSFEIVPGVSCVASVPAYAGIPITHRDFSSSIGIYSAHRRGGLSFSNVQWRQIVNGPDTLIFLMGKTKCKEIMNKLMQFGLPSATPAAIIYNGTLTSQRTVTGTVQTLGDMSSNTDETGPGTIVVGEVVQVRSQMMWFHETLSEQEENAWAATL